jgi:hypothetical protein
MFFGLAAPLENHHHGHSECSAGSLGRVAQRYNFLFAPFLFVLALSTDVSVCDHGT